MAKSKNPPNFIRKSKKKYSVCRCGGRLIQLVAYDGRPLFKCLKCDDSFTCGKNGGEYAKAVPMAPSDVLPKHLKNMKS